VPATNPVMAAEIINAFAVFVIVIEFLSYQYFLSDCLMSETVNGRPFTRVGRSPEPCLTGHDLAVFTMVTIPPSGQGFAQLLPRAVEHDPKITFGNVKLAANLLVRAFLN